MYLIFVFQHFILYNLNKNIEKMKKFLLIILFLLSVTLTSCLSSLSVSSSYYLDRFKTVDVSNGISTTGFDSDIVYDKETKVMYVVSRTGTFTVMVDENGKPLLYKENKQ